MISLALVTLAVGSMTFQPHGRMPMSTVYTRCGGANVSPELHWNTIPRGTRSFLVAVYDPDAKGGWYHWIAYNIPGNTRHLAAGVHLAANQLGTTSFGTQGYGGPCPPPGKVHHYYFTVYALNITGLAPGLRGNQLVPLMKDHIVGDGEIIGLYQTRK